MLSPLAVVETEACPAAVIRLSIPRERIREVMSPAIHEVIEAAASQGIGPAGPVFSRHFCIDPERFDFEVGVPVTGELSPVGRVVAGELPGARVVRTVYTGPYERLGEAWGEFISRLEAAGHRPAAQLWERYLTDPAATPDPADYQTELNRTLI